MEITIKLTEEQLDDVIRAAEDNTCKMWFMNDKKEYEDWAGDIVSDTIDAFLDALYMKYNIKIGNAQVWEN